MTDTAVENNEPQKRPDWFDFFLKEFDRESDRAAVILTSALIDDTLREVLESCMLACTSSTDPLFDGANAPLSTFSARIECAYRLGLITRDFASGLHAVRKIRNAFAHDVAGCSFTAQSVRSRVDSLIHLVRARESQFEKFETRSWSNPRDKFCFVTGYFLWNLKHGRAYVAEVDDSGALDCKFQVEEQ